ncbi:MAG: PAT family beta-lactamase induction signal transducer AmpG [Paraglaciecola psychrophila]|jgi:PAT family beta-lactamase induction signal transducer AmpG
MTEQRSISWGEALSIYTKKPVLAMILLGFSAGLPFLLVFSTLSAWLAEAGVTRTAIGFFAWVGITYSIKVLWAPVVDRLPLPLLGALLGQRRSWIMLAQLGIAAALVSMAYLDPVTQLFWVAVAAVVVAFCSATQDVAIDAYRIEAAIDEYQGAMSAAYIFGYRVALLVAGAGALLIAEDYSWSISYLVMAGCMSIGLVTVIVLREPSHVQDRFAAQLEQDLVLELLGENSNFAGQSKLKQWLLISVVCPFLEFFKRNGRFALVILLFISVFRLSDITMGMMANPFYLDMGYSKGEIASIAKFFGFFMTILGSALCGVLVVKWGIYRSLLLGAVLVASTNLLFALLAALGSADLSWLAVVISADNLSGGISSTAFIAYLSSLTNRSYTATQYALFSSLMTLPGKFISGFSGMVVDGLGYSEFFIFAALAGIPAIVLVVVVMRRAEKLQFRQ